MTSRYLLVSRIGPDSLHRRWATSDGQRNFDVLLSCYDETLSLESAEGITIEYRPGSKVAGYHGLLCERAAELAAYEYVALWDEDLEADVSSINQMFEIGAAHDLKVFQPALTPDSYYTYAGVLQQSGLVLRWVTFVEMMAPVFRTDTLPVIRDLHGLGYESGIDLIWSARLAEGDRDLAIIDSTPVRHTSPVGGRREANGFFGGSTYEDHIYDVLNRFDLPWQRCVPHAALTAGGRVITSPAVLTMLGAANLWAVPQRRPIWLRLRSVLVHLRHISLGPIQMDRSGTREFDELGLQA